MNSGEAAPARRPPLTKAAAATAPALISKAQHTFFVELVAKTTTWSEAEVRALLKQHDVPHSSKMPLTKYDLLCQAIEAGPSVALADA
jgi:hypothetical protein